MLKKICSIISTLMIVVLVIVAAALLIPRILGYETMSVISGSMEPEIPVGALVYIDTKTDTRELKEGDVITFNIGEGTRVTHRIDSIREDTGEFITKGDANNTADAEPVSPAQVAGKVVFSIPLLGYPGIYARTPFGIMILAGLALILFLPAFFSDK